MRDPHAPRFFYTPRLVTPRNNLSRCTWDSYPLSPGHTLIIFHVHIHLIPRYAGDHPLPQGGVRQVTPEKAHYPSSEEQRVAHPLGAI